MKAHTVFLLMRKEEDYDTKPCANKIWNLVQRLDLFQIGRLNTSNMYANETDSYQRGWRHLRLALPVPPHLIRLDKGCLSTMGTFGEIVEPVSRSTWEDWDDDFTDNISALQWQSPLEQEDSVDTLFILEGKYISECVKLHPQARLQLKNAVTEVNLNLYELPSNEYVCTIKDYDLLQSSEIVELLKPLLCKSTDVITIQTKPLLEYQTASQVCSPLIIRKLITSTPGRMPLDFKFEKLEQPNIVSGVAAGVTILREHLDLPATTLVCYIEHTEEYQTDEIQKILEKLKIIDSICDTKINSILNSNLYI